MIEYSPKMGTVFRDQVAKMEANVSFRKITLKRIWLESSSIPRQGKVVRDPVYHYSLNKYLSNPRANHIMRLQAWAWHTRLSHMKLLKFIQLNSPSSNRTWRIWKRNVFEIGMYFCFRTVMHTYIHCVYVDLYTCKMTTVPFWVET